MKNDGLLNTGKPKATRKFSRDDIAYIAERIEYLRSNNLSKKDLIFLCALRELEIMQRDLLIGEQEIKRIKLWGEGLKAAMQFFEIRDKHAKGGKKKAELHPNMKKQSLLKIWRSGTYPSKNNCALAEWERLGYGTEKQARKDLENA